jgi:hypothetical protein
MDHLQGKTVQIVRDNVVEPTQTVPASPFTITFATAATSSFQVGLDYTVSAKTMPTEPTLATGSVQGVKKRVVQIDALLHETKNLSLNGKQNVLDTAVQPFTGLKTAHGVLGYSTTGQITITQTVPLPMTVLGLEYKLSVGTS